MIEKKILIVDDDKPMARMLGTALKTLPMQLSISSVPSGEEAMLSVILDRPSLVIMDLGLPGMSGWDLLALVRKRNPQMAVILATGTQDDDVLRRGEDFHVDAVFFKPVEMKDLLEKVLELLGGPEPEQALTPPAAAVETTGLQNAANNPPEKTKSYKEIVRDLRQAMRADAAAILSDSGHLMVQTGKDMGALLNEGWEIIVMSALSASLALGKVVQSSVKHQYQLLKTGDRQSLLLLPVGRHGLLVFLSGEAADALTTESIRSLYEAQAMMSEITEPFMIDDTGHLTPLVEEAASELEEESVEVIADIDLDQLFAPAAAQADPDEFWEEAADVLMSSSSNTGFLNFSQAEQLGLVPDEEE